MTERPIQMRWQGDGFMPVNAYWAKEADKVFVIGEVCGVVAIEERSAKSHAHYFASINEAWQNLPEHLAGKFGSAEHLRKWCLIKAGYRDQRSIVVGSRAEALRLVPFIKGLDEFAVVTADGATVTAYTAKSQSMRAMGKKDFQESKDAVLRVASELIGVTPDALDRARAA